MSKKNVMAREYDAETLARIQKTELGILKDFMEVCDRHGLTYFGIAGTGIGALRHQGFIPWDDDIDVALPREDFNRFIKYAEEELSDRYFILNTEHYINYPLMTTRLCLKDSKFKEEALKNIDAPMGIFLDLYPFDKVSDNPKEVKKQARRAWFWSKVLILRSIPFPTLGFKGIKGKIIHGICGVIHFFMVLFHISKKWIYKKAYEAETMYNHYDKTTHLNFWSDTTPFMNLYKVSDIYPIRKLPYEDVMMSFPRDMHENLTGMYGDYMKLPPEDKRKNHYPFELEFPKDL